MSGAKHTPAPWRVIDDATPPSTGHVAEVGFNRHVVCDTRLTEQDDVWNALLIAAAPDLLVAAEALIVALDESDLGTCDFGKQRVAVEEAIAKARGGA